MSDVYTITVKAAGPLIVAGPVHVVDPEGAPPDNLPPGVRQAS